MSNLAPTRLDAVRELLSKLSDEELLDKRHKFANLVSEFNASEGNWSRETPYRLAAQADLWACDEELKKRGLQPRKGNYLL